MSKDVVVIGAGIVGASCAYHLAKRGARVRVLERAAAPGMEATGRSAAGVRHQFSHPTNVEMSLYSTRAFSSFEKEPGADADYRKVGYLFLVSPEAWTQWRAQAETQRSLGARVDLLEVEALAARFPDLNLEGLAGATLGLDDGVVDPHAVTMGYLRGAKQYGSSLHLHSEVRGLSFARGRWRAETNRGPFTADAVINAAGAYAHGVGQLAGLNIPVLPYRRNVYATGPLLDFPHPSPLMIDQKTGVWLRSEGTRFIMGLANENEPPSEHQSVDWTWLEHLLELALPRFPFLERAGLDAKACWAGLYAVTPDSLPILGEAQTCSGFFSACGFSGHGVQHSPATGYIVASEVLGKPHAFDLRDFRLERFTGGEGRAGPLETHAERNVV